MAVEKRKPTEQDEVRAVIEDWAEALRAKDVDRLFSHYAPDIVTFDLAPPLQHRGPELRRGMEEWLHTWQGPIGFDVTELDVTSGGDVAFTHSLNHMRGTRTDGSTTDVWLRATVCLRKIGGRWKATHEHASVPFYMDGSYRAAVDLKP